MRHFNSYFSTHIKIRYYYNYDDRTLITMTAASSVYTHTQPQSPSPSMSYLNGTGKYDIYMQWSHRVKWLGEPINGIPVHVSPASMLILILMPSTPSIRSSTNPKPPTNIIQWEHSIFNSKIEAKLALVNSTHWLNTQDEAKAYDDDSCIKKPFKFFSALFFKPPPNFMRYK